MSRKLTAALFVFAIVVAGAVAGLWFTGSQLQGAAPGATIAPSQAKEDGKGREAATIAQWQDTEQRLAAALPRVERDRQRSEAAGREAVLTAQQEEQRKLSDALRWAERYRQQREASEPQAKAHERKIAEIRGGLVPTLTGHEFAAEELGLRQRQEEERILAGARAKAVGVQLTPKDSDQNGNATGSVVNCTNGCKTKTSTPLVGAHARRFAANGRPAQGRRTHVAHAANVACPVLRWLHFVH